jgi:hypothetical protein
MPWSLLTSSTQQVGNGPSPRGQYGGEYQHEKPLIHWSGNCGPKQGEDRYRTSGDIRPTGIMIHAKGRIAGTLT